MSLYVGASASDYGLKTSGVINHNAAYTWMAWVDLASDINGFTSIWGSNASAVDDWQNVDVIGTGSDGVTPRLGDSIAGDFRQSYAATPLSVGVPAHMAVVRESVNTIRLYVNGVSVLLRNDDMTGRAAAQREQLGLLDGDRCPVRLTGIKQWQAALTADEIIAEMSAVRPLRLANLHSWHPAIANDLTTALKDFSGNGRDWTAQGTLSVQPESAPVGYGAPVPNAPAVVSSAEPQVLAPTSDISDGAWTPSTGTDNYACVDETAYSDVDYIAATTATTCELGLAAGSDPASSTGHELHYRLLSGTGTVAVALKQGSTTIASFGPHALTGAAQAFQQTLTGGQADSITDYTALSVTATSAAVPNITYVGGQVGGRAGSTSTSDITFALTGGSNSTPQAGDLVIIGCTVASAGRTPACAISGYTAQTQINANGTTYDTSLNLSHKFMTSTPDTTFTLPSTGNIQDAQRYTVQVWRGVDTGTPLDVAAVSASGTATGRPDPGSITPTTTGAVVGIVGAGAAATGASYTAPSGYATNFLTGTTSDTNDAMIGAGYRSWASGAENPDAYTGGTTNAADSWAAFTYALRPAQSIDAKVSWIQFRIPEASGPVTHATTGAIVGSGSTVSGSAAHIAIHGTTGALTGAGAVVAGSANRFRAHDTSGALLGAGSTITGAASRAAGAVTHDTSGTLVGNGSAVSGTANRFRTFATTGAIVGDGATIAGSASRFRAHPATGAIIGSGSEIAGIASRWRAFASSGVLTGSGATVSGTAMHNVPHATSGALVGQGAAISGTAARFRAFATSGALVGQGAAIAGTAQHNIPHATTGALVGQGAIIEGYANRGTGAVTHGTTGALVGTGTTVSGTAARFRAHDGSGSLVGTGAAVSGSAARTRQHDATGALIGQGSVLSGVAARWRAFASSGSLVGGGATVAGAAVRFRAHDTSGALLGPGSTIDGTAARSGAPPIHDTTGALVGQGATIDGTARRNVTHDTSGALTGSGAIIVGDASIGVAILASLGAGSYPVEKKKKRRVARREADDSVYEALPEETVSRLRDEFLSSALAGDEVRRAKIRKARAEEEALLLML